ncbi:hypothetical protein ACJRO7_014283 [Eucalyptus globulus]|uniref:Uncharacterized protein n=1 Tax=Eucalyptus globulus TaxID=34317 RepID=A0ABD3L0C9_EUCGL
MKDPLVTPSIAPNSVVNLGSSSGELNKGTDSVVETTRDLPSTYVPAKHFSDVLLPSSSSTQQLHQIGDERSLSSLAKVIHKLEKASQVLAINSNDLIFRILTPGEATTKRI